MNADVKPEVLKRTQELLGRHIKKPPLTDKLLKKPPFRFLHDIITSVIRSTGYLDGVLTQDEMNHENIKDKEGKIAFLQKVVDAVISSTGIHLTVRPTKIVAGHEPTKTNELLQAIGRALDDKRKGAEQGSQKRNAAASTKASTSKPATNEASKSKPSPPSKTTKQPAQPQEKSKVKDIDRKKSIKSNVGQNSKPKPSAQSLGVPSGGTTIQKETEIHAAGADLMGEIIDAGGNRESDAAAPVDESLDNVTTDLKHEDNTTRLQQQDVEMKRPPSAHLRQRQASALKPTGGQSEETASRQGGDTSSAIVEGNERATEKVPARRPMSVRPPTARPASARPAAPRIRDRGDVPRVDEPGIVTGKVNVITDNDTSQDQDDDNFLIVESKQAAVEEEKVPHNIPAVGDGHQGHLVAQILETQKDLEDKANHLDSNKLPPSKKVDIEWEGGRKRDRVAVKHEVDTLRSVVQKATSVVNPLGKLMDYVQEDVDAMQREFESWRDTNKRLTLQLREEQRLTDQAIQPMKLQLDQLEESIQEKRDQISSMKASILHNDSRIKQLVMGDVGSAH